MRREKTPLVGCGQGDTVTALHSEPREPARAAFGLVAEFTECVRLVPKVQGRPACVVGERRTELVEEVAARGLVRQIGHHGARETGKSVLLTHKRSPRRAIPNA